MTADIDKNKLKSLDDNHYKNIIANKLYHLANTMFGILIFLAIILVIMFFASKDNEIDEASGILALIFGVIFGICAPFLKLMLIVKAEQLELLHSINQKVNSKK